MVGHPVEVVCDQAAVGVERDRGALVPQEALDRVDVGAGADGQAGGGVAEVVRRQAVVAQRPGFEGDVPRSTARRVTRTLSQPRELA